MVCFNDSDMLVLGGYKFSKMHNRKRGILVTSVDPEDTTQSVVVSSNEGSALNVSNHSNGSGESRAPIRNSQQRKETELEKKAFAFCKLVNKMLRNQNSSVFVGYEVIYKMVETGLAKNRAEALDLGKDLSKKLRLFYRVEFKRNTFSDDGKLYKFRPDVLLSVIMKSPMTIQKLTPSDDDRKSERSSASKPAPTRFKKFARKKGSDEPKAEEPAVEINRYGKPMKKGRRPKAKQMIDEMHMIPHDQHVSSEKDWGHPRHSQRARMGSIRERSSEDDDESIYTEVTVSEHTSTFPPVRTLPQHEEDDDSYMELTVSTAADNSRHGSIHGSTHSYFDEYTLHEADEYDVMSVPTTPVVKEKIKVPVTLKSNVTPINDFFSPNDVAGFDQRRPSRTNPDGSLSSRMRRGELDIEIPYMDESDEIEDY